MLTHEKLYLLLGVRTLSKMKTPIVLNREEFTFPYDSIYIWNRDDEVPAVPLLEKGLLTKTKNAKMLLINEYFNPVGKNKLVKSEDNLLGEVNKITDIRTFSEAKKLGVVTRDSLLIVNGAITRYAYRYQPYLSSQYDITFNRLKTILKIASFKTLTQSRHRYININIGRIRPDLLQDIKKSMTLKPNGVLGKLTNDFELTLFFFAQMLDPDTRTSSPFNVLKESEMKEVTLIVQKGSKLTLLNLFDTVAMVKDYNLEGRLSTVSSTKALKLFTLFLLRFSNASEEPLVEITNKSLDIKDFDPEVEAIADIDIEEKVDVLLKEEGTIETPEDEEEEDVVTVHNKMLTLEELMTSEPTMEGVIRDGIAEGHLNQVSSNKISGILEAQELNGINKEIDISSEELMIPEANAKVPDIKHVPSKDMFNDSLKALDEHYIENIYPRDIKSVVYSFQKAGVIIEDYTVSKHKTIANGWDELSIKMTPIGGKTSTIKIPIPTLRKDGTIRNNGNNYKMVRQITDQPIRKINATTVVLNSYVGRITVSKALYATNNVGVYYNKQIVKLSEQSDSGVKLVISLPLDVVDEKLPVLYTHFSRETKSFTFKGNQLSFDFKSRSQLLMKGDKLSHIEKHGVLFGKHGKKYLVMNNKSESFITDGSVSEPIGHLADWIGISAEKTPIEFSSVQVFKEIVPSALMLAYYLGLPQLLSALNAKVTTHEPRKRFERQVTDLILKFDDAVLQISDPTPIQSMILGGFHNNKKTKELITAEMNAMNDTMLVMYGLSNRHIGEIKGNKDLFVDPITKSVLVGLDLPTTLIGLIFKASEMLEDDSYTHTNNMAEMMIKGQERIAGMLYHVLGNAVKDQKAATMFKRSAVSVKPFDVWNLLVNDSTLMLVEDINPMASQKQKHEITYTGFGGRTIETMTPKTREFHKSGIGVISSDSKDSGKVGVTIYASLNPLLKNVRGIRKEAKYEDISFSSKLSASVSLGSFATFDDTKRMGFIDIMNGHVTGSDKYIVLPIRTGYESVLPSRCGPEFCLTAKEPGVVTLVTDSTIEVKYKDSGIASYPLKTWFSKEESGSTFKHVLMTDLKAKDKFDISDAIYYDSMFFGPDMLNPKGIAYKMGMVIKTGYDESYGTYEDSFILTESGTKVLGTNVIKVRTKRMNASSEIFKFPKIGDQVTSSDILFQFGEGEYNPNNIFDNIKENNIKADYHGTVARVVCLYNAEPEDMSKSVKAFIKKTDKALGEFNNDDITGKVNSTFSESGQPVEDGEIIIKIYLDVNNKSSLGDKAILGNQLKVTAGEVRTGKYLFKGEEVQCFFSTVSEEARIVESATLQGLLNSVLLAGTKEFLEIFDKE